jgi:hypothetical protein
VEKTVGRKRFWTPEESVAGATALVWFTNRQLSLFYPPNVRAEWLALLLCIWEIPGSNLGPETGYPDRFFVSISLSRQTPG